MDASQKRGFKLYPHDAGKIVNSAYIYYRVTGRQYENEKNNNLGQPPKSHWSQE